MSPTPDERYAAIERHYGLGQWQQVLDTADALLNALDEGADAGLRQRVLLLQGHSLLHGLGQASAAAALYQRVLDEQPNPVLEAVARRELALAQSHTTEPTTAFPFQAEAVGTAPAGEQAAATPWLSASPTHQVPMAGEAVNSETVNSESVISSVVDEPEQIAVHQADPARAEIIDLEPLLTPLDPAPAPKPSPWSPAEEAELARGWLEVVLR